VRKNFQYDLDAAPAIGTNFIVYFDRSHAPAKDIYAMNETKVNKDILLADDDNDDVLIFETALKDIGYNYELNVVDNGDKLLVVLKDKLPYLLFLDIHLPCKDGLSCIIEIRKNRAYDQLPVIIYTSDNTKKCVEETYRNGANLYLQKADNFTTLTEKLKQVLAHDWSSSLLYPPVDRFMI
jgi:CheY-like chemotaxis protein